MQMNEWQFSIQTPIVPLILFIVIFIGAIIGMCFFVSLVLKDGCYYLTTETRLHAFPLNVSDSHQIDMLANLMWKRMWFCMYQKSMQFRHLFNKGIKSIDLTKPHWTNIKIYLS